jgi:hypothetical protein
MQKPFCPGCARGRCVMHGSLFAELDDDVGEASPAAAPPGPDSRAELGAAVDMLRVVAARVRREHPGTCEAVLAQVLAEVPAVADYRALLIEIARGDVAREVEQLRQLLPVAPPPAAPAVQETLTPVTDLGAYRRARQAKGGQR